MTDNGKGAAPRFRPGSAAPCICGIIGAEEKDYALCWGCPAAVTV